MAHSTRKQRRTSLLMLVLALAMLASGQQSALEDAPAETTGQSQAGLDNEGMCFAKEQCADAEAGAQSEKDKYKEPEKGEKKVVEVEEEVKVNKKWKKYLKLIDKAMASYEECQSTNCSCYNSQIELDLAPWAESGVTASMLKEAGQVPRNSLYQIIGGKLYRSGDPMFPARSSGVEHFLLKVAKDLPDTEFVLNTKDWPQTQSHRPLPIFSFSKVAREHSDIMYPAWTFWEGGPAISTLYPNGLGRWDQQLKSIPKAAKKWPWSQKTKKAFFRGSRTSPERDPLVVLAQKEPSLVDASYTKNQAWKSDADTLGLPPAAEISLEDHCQYKYLFNFRGVAASFRFKHLFLCDSLVYHVDDQWLEFFYAALRPWVHYIPVGRDLREARDLIQFAIENDDVAKAIARRGRNFIIKHLRMEDVTCYWRELLTQYTRLLKFKPKLNKKLKRIK